MKCLHTVLIVFWLLATLPSQALADEMNLLLSTLSTAKAQTEGRTQRVIGCSGLRDPATKEMLRGRFDDARNHFNGRIDAWIFSLKSRKQYVFDADAERKEITGAIAKINEFIQQADRSLASVPCETKVFWATAVPAAIAIIPPAIELLKFVFSRIDTREEERSALIAALSRYKISEWGVRADLVAFDIKSQSFIPNYMLDDEVARGANTAVYVNKWVLKAGADAFVFAAKQPPGQLSRDYVFFTGKPSEIDKFVLEIRP